jgi:YbbR domain-containing protein
MELVERPRSDIDVIIRAPRRLIPKISQVTVYAILDLKNASVNLTQYSINRNMVITPEGAEVKEIYPSQVNLKLEMTKEIELEIEANITGKLPEGYRLNRWEVEPPTVLVKGPESKLNEQLKVQTFSIDISAYTESTNVETNLILPNPDLRFSSIAHKVIVKLLIEEVKEEDGNEEIKNPTKKRNDK